MTDRGFSWAAAALLLVGVLSGVPAGAQPGAWPPVPALQPIVQVAPDALDDGLPRAAAWPAVEPIDRFLQVTPTPGAAPSRRTELRLAHDGRTLFVSIRAFDPVAAGRVAQQMRRDADALLFDDHVALVIDVEGQGRNGHLFAVNPNGTAYDSLIFDGGQERRDWDAPWHAEARIEADGWTALMAIPLSALGVRRDPGSAATWRINAERWMPGGNERVRLAGLRADQQVFSLADALPLPAIRPERSGLGLRFKPSLRATYASSAASGRGEPMRRLEPGLEVFHQSETGLRTAAALNIDFGEAEADERTVNLTRFELFRPEKREFFLRDAGRFSFGGLVEQTAVPFYSRRIGLDAAGRARSLDAGLKLSGEVGGFDLGVFGARVAGGPVAPGAPDAASADVAVLRLARPLGERHRIGLIATQGNPQGTSGSRLWGVDHQFRETQWRGDKTLETHAWAQQSTNHGLGTGHAWGGRVAYPNLGFTAHAAVQRIGRGFEPALGYLAESGVTSGEGDVGYWHRSADGLHLIPGIDWSFRRTLDGAERSVLLNPELFVETAGGDMVAAEVFFERDRVAHAYDAVPGLTLVPGDYRWHYLYGLAETSPSRPVSLKAELRSGGYYDGRRNDQVASVRWHPSPRYGVQLGGSRADIRLSTGQFTVRTASLRIDHTPSTRFAQSLVLQWDNVSHELGASARVRWPWGRGRELLFSLDRLGHTGERRPLPRQTTAMLKLVWNVER